MILKSNARFYHLIFYAWWNLYRCIILPPSKKHQQKVSKWQKQRRRHEEQFSGSHGRRGYQDKKDKQITRTRDRQDRQI